MSGLAISNGVAEITYGARRVATTNGTLVCLLPTRQTFNRTVTFPDFAKDYYYHWEFDERYRSGDGSYAIGNSAQAFITAKPQEYSSKQTLMAIPAGADFFLGQVVIQRTGAPANTWMGGAINCLAQQGVWMPWRGSCVVEQMINMTRAIHVSIEGASLVLELEQSVGPAPGGYGSYGDSSPASVANKTGHTETYGSVAGMPVWTSTSAPYRSEDSATGSDWHTINWKSTQLGNTKSASVSDPTNYASTYSLNIRGRFGRRS